MAGHRSASIATCGARRAIIITMCMSTSGWQAMPALRYAYRAHSGRAARHALLSGLPEAYCGVKKACEQLSVPPGKFVKVTLTVAGILTGCCPCNGSVNDT